MSMADGAPLEDPAPRALYLVYDQGVDGRAAKALERAFDNLDAAVDYVGDLGGKTIEVTALHRTAASARTHNLVALRDAALSKLTDVDRLALGLMDDRIAEAQRQRRAGQSTRRPARTGGGVIV